mmetsp:Transcript_2671/g.10675  ORF Transcript_2671/g.10675 Transcript_2671/m.10675 type:complete len:217 (-) Transcript_2671:748-1398(-)
MATTLPAPLPAEAEASPITRSSLGSAPEATVASSVGAWRDSAPAAAALAPRRVSACAAESVARVTETTRSSEPARSLSTSALRLASRSTSRHACSTMSTNFSVLPAPSMRRDTSTSTAAAQASRADARAALSSAAALLLAATSMARRFASADAALSRGVCCIGTRDCKKCVSAFRSTVGRACAPNPTASPPMPADLGSASASRTCAAASTLSTAAS